MIITRAPYRVSFFGGGTDYPEWYEEHGGVFLSSAIDHHINIVVRIKPSLDLHKYRMVWRELEDVNSRDAIKHPFVRAALDKRDIQTGLDIVYFGQLPHGSGIGSSSTFGAAFLAALNAMMNCECSPYELAQEVFDIEHNVLGETVGIQDQFAASFGGFNFGTIEQDGAVSLEPIKLQAERLRSFNDKLLFVFSGKSRYASSIAQAQIESIPVKQAVLREMQQLAYEAKSILCSNSDLDDFGRLLHESWMLKKSLTNSISTAVVNDMYEAAKSAGALGGKLLGAGGGGFMLFYVPESARESVTNVLSRFAEVPISLGAAGTEVVMHSPQKYSDNYDKVWLAAYGE